GRSGAAGRGAERRSCLCGGSRGGKERSPTTDFAGRARLRPPGPRLFFRVLESHRRALPHGFPLPGVTAFPALATHRAGTPGAPRGAKPSVARRVGVARTLTPRERSRYNPALSAQERPGAERADRRAV